MTTYRVFLDRHYIDVIWFDIESDTPKHAEADALKAAKKIIPNSRARATDNGWIPDNAVEIPFLDSSSVPSDGKIEEVLKTKNSKVYIRTNCLPIDK